MSSRTVSNENQVLASDVLERLTYAKDHDERLAILVRDLADTYDEGHCEAVEKCICGITGAVVNLGVSLGLSIETSLKQVELVIKAIRKEPGVFEQAVKAGAEFAGKQ